MIACNRACLLALVLGIGVGTGRAQESVSQGSISGRVTDPQGAVIAGAEVRARQTETNVTTSAVTDDEGRFRLGALRLGPYHVTATRTGFSDASQTLVVLAGSAFDLTLSLPLAGVAATVAVSAEPAIVEGARTQVSATVTQAEIRALPMNGRNFLDLALLVPGVAQANLASTQLFPETSAVPGSGLAVSSQRNLSNSFVVDGLSANDDAAGLSGIPYSVDALEVFQVVTSGGQAELGRALGGYVNVVTRSGTNALRGDLFGYVRDDRFNAPNALSRTTLPMSQKQYGLSVGGPLRKDRTFLFANLEHRLLDQTGFTTVPQATVDVINARLTATGYGGSAVRTGIYDNPVHTVMGLAKVDHRFERRGLLSVRYSAYSAASENARGAGGLATPSASSALDNLDQVFAVSHTQALSSTLLHEVRAQVVVSDLQAPPTDPLGPNVSIAGVASFGTLSSSPARRQNRMTEIVESLTRQQGAHAVRAGVTLLVNEDDITFPRARRGSYTFSSLANFLSGTYNNQGFTQTFGEQVVSQTNPNVGLYAQDEWRLRPGLTANLGLRYDLQSLDTITTDTNNVAPRVGLAWTPGGSRRTVVRGSAGIFYDRVPLRALANALLSAGNTTDLANLRQIGVSLSPTQAGAPAFPGTLAAAVPTVTLVNLTTMDRQLQNARSRQASVEVERQFGAATTVSASYHYLQGLGLIMAINQNVPTCVAAGTNNGCRPNPNYANNSQYSSAGESSYHGLHVSLVERPAAWSQVRVSYTLSTAMNNVGEAFFSGPIDPFDLSKDWGRSDSDQRHRLVVNGSVHTPLTPATTTWERLSHGFQLSGILQAYSATPFNLTSGVTTLQGTVGRPVVNGNFIPRNAGESTPFFSLGLRMSRSVPLGGASRLELLAEVFNLTNHLNVVARNTNFGSGAYPASPSATFGQVTAVGDPRSWQLGARVRF